MIKGKRVYLRLIEKSDIHILNNICKDDKVTKFNSVLPDKKYLLKNLYIINRGSNKILTIINEKDVVIGFADYRVRDQAIYTIGITIARRFWRRGYGRESINTLVDYLFKELGAREITAEIVEKNTRAIECCKSCGFLIEKLTKDKKGLSIVNMFLKNTM